MARRPIDQHDFGVIAEAIEHNPLTIACYIKGSSLSPIIQSSQRTHFHGRQVQQGEILRAHRAYHVDQALAIRQEPHALSVRVERNFRQSDGKPIRLDTQEGRVSAYYRAVIHDQAAYR